ncbi:hypothetical protein F5Y10DRAFT_232702 [Nemania abortiva]|nr:hypothetical protein F5Y10DRAFT_232702 [Nemania abortiva]
MVPVADAISRGKWAWFSSKQTKTTGRPLRDLESMDDASRGPWGSIVWLHRHPSRLNVVNMGAILTILVLPLNFLSQQLVSIGTRSVVDPSGYAHILWARNSIFSEPSMSGLKVAHAQGIYSPTVEDLPVMCSSGNCTWNIVPSVGVCGECADITNKMFELWTIDCNGIICNYTSDANQYSSVAPRQNSALREDLIPIGTSLTLAYIETPRDTYNHYDDISSIGPGIVVAQFDVFKMLGVSNNVSTGWWYFKEPSLIQCMFWVCMQAFDVRVVAGETQQPVQSTRIPSVTNINESAVQFNDLPGFNMNKSTFTSIYPSNLGDTYEPFANHPLIPNQTYFGSDYADFWNH